MYKYNKKGQSTVEYVLLVTAVVAVMIAFVTNKSGGLQGQLNTTLVNAGNDMATLANSLATSQATGSGSVTNPASVVVTPPSS